MLELYTLASGSDGNAILVSDGMTHVLIDAGISCRKITQRLDKLDFRIASLSGIFITHEHSDHISGLSVLLKNTPIPVYATPATGQQIVRRCPRAEGLLYPVSPGIPMVVGSLSVTPFSTSHDAADSVGYILEGGGGKIAILTDLGVVSPHILTAASGADLALVETNYDPDWLREGSYPLPLKQRILSDRGHLSNEAGGELICSLATSGTRQFVLGHLSRENNTPARALDTVCQMLDRRGLSEVTVEAAPRDELSRRFVVC